MNHLRWNYFGDWIVVVAVNDTTSTFRTARQNMPLITKLPTLSAFLRFPFLFIRRWNFEHSTIKDLLARKNWMVRKYVRKFNSIEQTWKITPMPTITCTNNDKIINVALMMNVFSSELYVIRNRSWFAFAVNKAISIMPTSRSFESN